MPAHDLTPDRVLALVQGAVAVVLEVPAETVLPQQRFAEDLGADSLALVEIVDLLEEQVRQSRPGFRLDDQDLDRLTSVQVAVDYVCARL